MYICSKVDGFSCSSPLELPPTREHMYLGINMTGVMTLYRPGPRARTP